MSSARATLAGFGAIALWSTFTAMAVSAGGPPPFQLSAMTFALAGALGSAAWLRRPGTATRALRQRPTVWLIGVGGLFGYHALYYTALRLAPPAEAQLVNNLWPLLIVLFSAALPGVGGLRARHLLGAALGFAGVVVLIGGRGDLALGAVSFAGYAAAAAAACVWAAYSLLSRAVGDVPTEAVTGFCLATAALSLLCHLLLEDTRWPDTAGQWACVVGLGLGPVGIAFFLWDVGMKKGDIRLLGVGSYLVPVLSTLLLVVLGFARATPALALACVLIVGGAALAATVRPASRPA